MCLIIAVKPNVDCIEEGIWKVQNKTSLFLFLSGLLVVTKGFQKKQETFS